MLVSATSAGAYVLLLVIGAIGAAIGVRMARTRGRNTTLWGIVCFLFPLLGIIALAIAGKTEERKREDVQKYLPPVLAAPTTVTAEWRADPSGRHEYRYWDGSGWSDTVSDHGAQSVDPMTATTAQPGEWRADPSGRHEYRYWDGSGWSDTVSDHGAQSVDPMTATTAQPGEWRADPSGRHEYRYWDGRAWSDNVSDHGQSAIDPLMPAEPEREEQPVAGGTKICPECAEEIKAGAVKCRFCGHHFEPEAEPRELIGAAAERS